MTRRIAVKVCCSPALAQFWPSVRHPAVKARNSFLRASRRSIWGHDPGENFDQPARDWSDPATFPSGVSRRATLEAAEQQLIVVKQLRLSSVVWRKIEAAALATGQGAPGTFQTALALLWPCSGPACLHSVATRHSNWSQRRAARTEFYCLLQPFCPAEVKQTSKKHWLDIEDEWSLKSILKGSTWTT